MWPALPWFRIGAVLVLAVALFTGVQWVRGTVAERDELRAKVNTLADALEDTRATARATEKALTGRLADRTRLAQANKELTNAIPRLVPADSPALPPGFRVLHDAAAAGVPPPASGASGPPVPPEVVAETIVDNYGTCLDNASRLERLQQWVMHPKD